MSIPNVSATIEVTIPNGQSVSQLVDLGSHIMVAFHMPAAWTAAGLSFLSATGPAATPQAVHNGAGELTLDADAGQIVSDPDTIRALAPLRFLQIRSGTAAAPVNQAADRTITLITKRGS